MRTDGAAGGQLGDAALMQPLFNKSVTVRPLLSGVMGVFVCLFGRWLMLHHCHTLHEYKSHTLLQCPIVSLRVTQLFQMECVLGQ